MHLSVFFPSDASVKTEGGGLQLTDAIYRKELREGPKFCVSIACFGDHVLVVTLKF